MSINTLPHKMVALKVIQWDLTDRILRGWSKCFIMQFSWLQCNLMYLSFLAFHNFSLHQFAAGSAGAGSPAGRRGGSGGRGATIFDSNYTKVLYVRSHLLLNFTLLLTCTSLQWKRQKLSILHSFLPIISVSWFWTVHSSDFSRDRKLSLENFGDHFSSY